MTYVFQSRKLTCRAGVFFSNRRIIWCKGWLVGREACSYQGRVDGRVKHDGLLKYRYFRTHSDHSGQMLIRCLYCRFNFLMVKTAHDKIWVECRKLIILIIRAKKIRRTKPLICYNLCLCPLEGKVLFTT